MSDRDNIHTVWLVEDAELLRSTLQAVIDAESDFECPVAVRSCEDFLAALDTESPPHLAIVDIGLPGLSGLEAIRRLRSLSPASRALVLSVHGSEEKVFEALCAGASGYLLKPSNPDQVVDALRQVLRGAAPINGFIARRVLEIFAKMAPAKKPSVDAYRITTREGQILEQLVDGLTLPQIARRFDLSIHTVDSHVRNVYAKLHVRTRSGAVSKAIRERLV
ncbi:MAG: response regulator transcription factor [Acidobacteria bacterium]|nr:response regulator transcription factor [Acidobacteriota bacterium]